MTNAIRWLASHSNAAKVTNPSEPISTSRVSPYPTAEDEIERLKTLLVWFVGLIDFRAS